MIDNYKDIKTNHDRDTTKHDRNIKESEKWPGGCSQMRLILLTVACRILRRYL